MKNIPYYTPEVCDGHYCPMDCEDGHCPWADEAMEAQAVQLDSAGIYDQEEIYTNCTVQVWRNSVTGEESIGWWRNEEESG